MKGEVANRKRPYRMKARAEASAETLERILASTEAAFSEGAAGPEELTLALIAERAGVSVQTILERFGSKERLFEAVIARIGARTAGQRSAVGPGDLAAAARVMVKHYEEIGDGVLRALSEEARYPAVAAMVSIGRTYHREWCERVFEPNLVSLAGLERERRLAQFVLATDVYAWKVLRRDRELSARQTETAMLEMLEALAGSSR